MQIRLCDDKKIELSKELNLSDRKTFIFNLIENNLIYKDYYYNKEDGKITLDFLATYFLNGEHMPQDNIKKNSSQNLQLIKTYFKNNTLVLIPSKETKNLKKIRVIDKKIKRNNIRINDIINKYNSIDELDGQTYHIENLKFQNDELKKDLYYLIDDYICETKMLVNYGK